MTDIKLNEYVRTEEGYIAKLIDTDEIIKYFAQFDGMIEKRYGEEQNFAYLDTLKVVKHSFNIIDLIEAGDYVNGYKVDEVINGDDIRKGCEKLIINKYLDTSKEHEYYERFIYKEDIKSIITKEQFESVSYKVGEEK